MRKRKRREDDSDNPDRWMVSYADFITLLFAFFTTMYAISQVDLVKLDRFAGSMKSALKAPEHKEAAPPIIEGIKPPNYDDTKHYEDAKLEKEIRGNFEKSGIIEHASISRDERGVRISLGDTVLFDTGSAELKEEARPLLSAVAEIIRATHNEIFIEGHTDNIPIRNSRYSSNWELSTARAMSVLMSLLRDYHFAPERFAAAGYGEHRPIASNASPEGRMKNRRVDIVFAGKKEGT